MKVLELATDEARSLSSKIIGTEYILLGILRDLLLNKETFIYGFGILRGVSIESVKSEIAKLNNDSNT